MELRPGYKLTEVGPLPADWDVARLGSLASFASGCGIRVSSLGEESAEAPVPVFGGNGIAGYTQRPLVEDPTVVVGRVGQRCGAVYLTPGPAWITDNALYPRTKHREFDTHFLACALAGARLNNRKNRNDLPLITQTILESVVIPWPPRLPEQRAIAAALSDVDALAGGLHRLIAKKRDLKQAAMQRLLTGQTRLPGFHGRWETKRLEELADTDPEGLSTTTAPHYQFQYIALEDVDRGVLRSHSEQLFGSAPSRARRRLRPNDVLVSTVRPNLQSHLLFREQFGEWVCSTGFCVLRCRAGNADPDYVFSQLFMGSVVRQVDALLTGSNYPAINSGDVRALQVPVPPYDEQIAIAAVLADMDAELAALEARREKTHALKQAMMQELLTGRTRLI